MGYYTLTIHRKSGQKPDIEHTPDLPPVTALIKERANMIARAVLQVEQDTAMPFESKLVITGDHYNIAVETKKGVEPYGGEIEGKPAAALFMGCKYLTGDKHFKQEHFESLLLHEMGHQHCRPFTQRFSDDREAQKIYRSLNELRWACRDDHAKVARVIRAYGSVDAFKRDADEMAAMLHARYETLKESPLAGVSNAQVADWLMQEGRKLGSTPLAVLEALPSLPPRFVELRKKLYQALLPGGDAPPLDKAAIDAVERHAAAVTTPILGYVKTACALTRGEELLCDDFSMLHSHKPAAVLETMALMRDIIQQSAGRGELSTHPSYEEREARMKALARSVTDRTVQPRRYAEWVSQQYSGGASLV